MLSDKVHETIFVSLSLPPCLSLLLSPSCHTANTTNSRHSRGLRLLQGKPPPPMAVPAVGGRGKPPRPAISYCCCRYRLALYNGFYTSHSRTCHDSMDILLVKNNLGLFRLPCKNHVSEGGPWSMLAPSLKLTHVVLHVACMAEPDAAYKQDTPSKCK